MKRSFFFVGSFVKFYVCTFLYFGFLFCILAFSLCSFSFLPFYSFLPLLRFLSFSSSSFFLPSFLSFSFLLFFLSVFLVLSLSFLSPLFLFLVSAGLFCLYRIICSKVTVNVLCLHFRMGQKWTEKSVHKSLANLNIFVNMNNVK